MSKAETPNINHHAFYIPKNTFCPKHISHNAYEKERSAQNGHFSLS